MLGQLRLAQNRNPEAVRFSEDEVELWRAIGDARGLAHGLLQLTMGLRRQWAPARAMTQACEALELFSGLGETWGELGSMIAIAACAAALGQVEVAGRVLAAADELSRITGAVPIPTWQEELEFARSRAVGAAAHVGLTLGEVLEDARLIAARSTDGTESHTQASGRLTRREIADTLVLSVRTVERHITNIYSKTGVTNRREAEAFLKKARS